MVFLSLSMKIGIIKLGAKGDVVRTLPILKGLKNQYPDSEITWITKDSSFEVLSHSDMIDRIFSIPVKLNEKFDILYNFDIDEVACELAIQIEADKKFGFYFDNSFVCSFNLGAEYYLNTLFDDETKKLNKKTYQKMIFDVAEIEYRGESFELNIGEDAREYADRFFEGKSVERLIGIHIGSSPRWPSKSWHLERLIEFVRMVKERGWEIILFSGPDDVEKCENIKRELNEEGIFILYNNPKNSDLEFFSLVGKCDAIVCSDSYALHVGLGLKKPVVGLFFCTSPNEVEDYGLLKKIVSRRLYEFFPEKMDVYDEELTKSISVEEVLEKLEENIKTKIGE